MMNIQKAVIAWAKMCETDLDRVTNMGLHLDSTTMKIFDEDDRRKR